MTEISDSQLQLFAKLSKVLAQTFDDIHKICLRQSGNNDQSFNSKKSEKTQWLEKRDESKLREDGKQFNQYKIEAEQDAPKQKMIKQNNLNRQKKQQRRKKIAKWQQEGKPRPPLNAFMLFLRDSKIQIMQAKPELTPSQVSAYASALWNQLTQDEKQKYRGQYRQNRVRYDEELKQFHEKQKNSGKQSLKIKKGVQKFDKIQKDILDKDFINAIQSDVSSSNSGI